MQRTAALLLLFAGLIPSASCAERLSKWRAVWHVSQVFLAGAETADVASSWGKNEANPLVRAGQRFSYGSVAIKLGAFAGSLTAQHFILRRNPERLPVFASANLAAAAMLGIVAHRNMQVPR